MVWNEWGKIGKEAAVVQSKAVPCLVFRGTDENNGNIRIVMLLPRFEPETSWM
jgi:hypothetical protein